MGKRSRKRPSDGARPSEGATRAERDAARRERARQARAGAADTPAKPPRPRSGRPSLEERPPPLWHPFPLTELIILAGIVLMAWGFLSGAEGSRKIAAGLGLTDEFDQGAPQGNGGQGHSGNGSHTPRNGSRNGSRGRSRRVRQGR